MTREAPDEFTRFTAAVQDVAHGLLWLRSSLDEWRQQVVTQYEADALRRMWVLADHVDGLVTMARANPHVLPPAFAAGRSAFETGLMTHWLLVGQAAPGHLAVRGETEIRHLQLLESDARWADGLTDRLRTWELRAGRWSSLAQERWDRLTRVRKAYGRGDQDERLPRPPSVVSVLRDLDLERLYWGYMVSSQWVHGTTMGATELDPFRPGAGPPGFGEWYLPMNLGVWGLVLAARGFARRPDGPGLALLHRTPVGDAQAAVDVFHELSSEEWVRHPDWK
ncbi:hypothetical protein DQ239_07115 [Blastococcus sp. TF02-09]|uniref:hypothetical protein n=1 Tax=Blastococcus sp. TF02-09 TaxID=2250576 RepID=UPI000DE9FF4B|nr:hypothetical protein [Blastococcus sp. TF02-9]RBY79383.1 hypothetical protein DQ239_07115 [Blastococcus sp. TF02-9]